MKIVSVRDVFFFFFFTLQKLKLTRCYKPSTYMDKKKETSEMGVLFYSEFEETYAFGG